MLKIDGSARKVTALLFMLLIVALVVTACAPSEDRIATAVAQTLTAQSTDTPLEILPSATQEPFATEEPFATQAAVEFAPPAPGIWSARFVIRPDRFDYSNTLHSFAMYDNRVFVETPEGRIEARDLTTGGIIWTLETGGAILGADSENVYVAPSPQRIEALDATTGAQKWRSLLDVSGANFVGDAAPLFPPEPFSPNFVGQSIIADRTIHVTIKEVKSFGPGKALVVTLDKETGNVLWLGSYDLFRYVDNVLIVAEKDNYLGLSPETGARIWGIIPWGIEKLSICDTSLLYFIRDETTSNGFTGFKVSLSALDPSTGSPLWVTEVSPSAPALFIECHPLPDYAYTYSAPGSEYIYLHSDRLVSIDSKSGEIRWLGMALGESGYRFLGEAGHMVVYSHRGFGLTQAYDADTHTLLWENSNIVLDRLAGQVEDTLVGVVDSPDNSRSYVSFGLDSKTGKEKWKRQVEKKYPSVRPLKIVGDYLIDDEEGRVTFLAPQSGSEMATFTIEGGPVEYLLIEGRVIVRSIYGEIGYVSVISP